MRGILMLNLEDGSLYINKENSRMQDSKGPLIEEVDDKSTDESSDFNTDSKDSAKLNEEEKEKMAEEFKTKGNDYFKEGKFNDALQMYSEAIFMKIKGKKAAVYFSNRAFVHIKLENYAIAIMDATRSLQEDSNFVKALYRRGCAYLLLGDFDSSLKDFARLCKLLPADKDARQKYEFVKKEKRLRQLQEAIVHQDESSKLDLKAIVVPSSYQGPRIKDEENFQDLTPEWCVELMNFIKTPKNVLHKRYALLIILKCKEIFKEQKSLIDVEFPETGEFTVCGDIHGQFYDLLNIFKLNGNPSTSNPYLFNGDFVDRGSFSVEVIITLMAWKIALPQHFYMSRGNHESKNMNMMYGFEGEVVSKYDKTTYNIFGELFQHLPLAHCLNRKVLVLHGGLFSKDDVCLDDIRKIDRIREPPDEGLMCESLWSDPMNENGRRPSKRGVGIQFGPDVAKRFLDGNDLKLLVRSHEVKDNGYEVQKGGRVITVFSAPNYCDQMKNKGALIRFNGKSMEPKYTVFQEVEHPPMRAMAYAKPFAMF